MEDVAVWISIGTGLLALAGSWWRLNATIGRLEQTLDRINANQEKYSEQSTKEHMALMDKVEASTKESVARSTEMERAIEDKINRSNDEHRAEHKSMLMEIIKN